MQSQHAKTVARIGRLAELLVVAAFFVLWRQFDFSARESFQYCFSAWLILHALVRMLRPVAKVLDRAQNRAMIVVGIAKFLVSLALPILWKGLDVPFWQSLVICGGTYFALHLLWRYLDKRSTPPRELA